MIQAPFDPHNPHPSFLLDYVYALKMGSLLMSMSCLIRVGSLSHESRLNFTAHIYVLLRHPLSQPFP